MANKYMKKMFNILCHQVKANKNYIEIPPHPIQKGLSSRKQITTKCSGWE
jgi:hypothetical protein